MSATHYDKIIRAAETGKIGEISQAVFAYRTQGGTWILASKGSWTDSGNPRDLLAVLPAALSETRVVPLYLGVASDLVAALREALDGESSR